MPERAGVSKGGPASQVLVGPRCCRKADGRWAQQDSNLRPSDYESAALTS